MSLSRREFIWALARRSLGVGGAAVLWPEMLRAQTPPAAGIFQHGVASGDPLADRVILWTRITSPAPSPEVRWRVASDEALSQIVASGTARTSAERDFTIKVDAGGLQPGRTYYYAFEAGGDRSPIGRTKTLPAATDRVRLAVVSCSNYPAGYFNVYRCVANRAEIDAVVHLGDYIYEFQNGIYGDGSGLLRIPQPPKETVTLSDYRIRYATYRTDPDLQAVHQQHPMIAVWDDHELTNDAWLNGAANHNPSEGEGDWPTRRAAAYQAYMEWMPIREASSADVRLYRHFRFGTLADLLMLDTRGLRDEQVPADDLAALADPNRSLLGAAQESWLFDRLRTSQRDGTTWRVLGQQIMFSRLGYPNRPVPLPDIWDGYQAARQRVLDAITGDKIENLAILAGDIHSSWAFDVPRNPFEGYTRDTGAGSLAVELVTPAVSSPPLFTNTQIRDGAPVMRALMPHLKLLEGDHRGYLVVDITPTQLRGDWFHVPGVLERSAAETRAASFVCERGSARLAQA